MPLQNFDDHELHALPFIYNITTEPVENWDTTSQLPLSSPSDDDELVIVNSNLDGEEQNDATIPTRPIKIKKKRTILSAAIHKSFKLIKANYILCRDDYPVEINDVYELRNNEGAHEI